jgi:hypothetical protein
MKDFRPNSGGVPPDDGGAHGHELPDLPPEWGTIVIPDNAAELDAEADELRRELRRDAWQRWLRRMTGLRPGRRADATSIGVPLVIMAVAVITTLLSLFVVTWDHRRNATAPVGPDSALQQGSVPIADVTLADATGSRVRLGNLVPAILLLVEDCDCADLIKSVAVAAPAPVTVVPVSVSAPCALGSVKSARCLVDPGRVIFGRYPTVAEALALSAPATPPAVPPPSGAASAEPGAPAVATALAVPVDADGNAGDPILVTSPADLKGAFAALTAGG